MPNRRRIGYMPSRRFDDERNIERQKTKRRRARGGSEPAGADGYVPLEEWTKDELYALATERGIRGRSKMTKEKLIDSLR